MDEGYQAAIMVQNTYTWRQTKMGENPFIAPWSTEAMLKERIERRDEEQQCAEALLQEETERREEQNAMDERYQAAIMAQRLADEEEDSQNAIMAQKLADRLDGLEREAIEWRSQNHVASVAFQASYRTATGFLVPYGDEGNTWEEPDQGSDPVLDTCLHQEPKSKVACDKATEDNMVIVSGETRAPFLRPNKLRGRDETIRRAL